MKLEEKIKLLAERHILGIRKATKIGTSYGLILPKSWLQAYCIEVDGDYYFTLRVDDTTLTFTPIEPSDVETVSIREKK